MIGEHHTRLGNEWNPKPGDIGLARIRGKIGKVVDWGQGLNGDPSFFTHAYLVLSPTEIIEAETDGAKIHPLNDYDTRRVAYLQLDLDSWTRTKICEEGRKLEGTPYSFADYLALFLERFNLGFGFTRNYVRTSGHMICSQLVDEAYRRAGVHLFDDGRLPQDVTPGDLARLL